MIPVFLDLSNYFIDMGLNDKIEVFQVDAPLSMINEIIEAIQGETQYNKSIVDFGGLQYVIKD